jgi:putative ABC transport system permease protein
MGLWRTLSIRIRAVFDRNALDHELDEEVRFHIEQETRANLARGMKPEEAARQARMDFGGEQSVKEEYRAVRGDSLVESALQDARFGLRMLRRSPGFAIVAAITLALGLGANTAMFSVIDAVLLRPLPFANPDRLVYILDQNPSKGFFRFTASPPNFIDWRAQAQSFTGMAATAGGTFTLSGSGDAQRLNALFVTPDLFAVLGVNTVVGRTFTSEEGTYGHDKVAILSFRLWQQRFGGDRSVLGRTIKLDGENYVVVGVAPAEFRLYNNDVVVPLAFRSDVGTQRGAHFLLVYARLKPGISLQHANDEMRTIAARLAAAYPDKDSGWTAYAVQMHELVVGRVRPAMLILFGAVGFLALIACANVANLLLSRAVARQREISVRTALGATRSRIMRQLLTESFALCVSGALLGMAIAAGGIHLLRLVGPIGVPRLSTVQLNTAVLVFTAGLTLLTTMLFGILPALHASRVDVNAGLKSAGRGTVASRESARPRKLLVLAELALSIMLLIGAGLLIRSFVRLTFTNPGVDASDVLTFNLSLPTKKYATPERIRDFYDALLTNLRALPGVKDAGAVSILPLSGDQNSSSFTIRGAPVAPQDQPSAELRVASRDYFRTIGIPLLHGRQFETGDRMGSPPVVLVSESMARKFWPNGDAIGHFITMGVRPGISHSDVGGEIVGIVGDVHDFGLDIEPTPTVYVLMDIPGSSEINIVVRTTGDPTALVGAARATVAALDADIPVADPAPMETVLATSLAQRRFYMLLLSIFAAVALSLAGIGLYGVISYSVGQRTQEIGVRMALGATRGQVLGMILSESLRLAGTGIGVGIIGALALNRLLKGMLVGVSTTDPAVFVVAALGIGVIAIAACFVPARRATAVDPVVALRYE